MASPQFNCLQAEHHILQKYTLWCSETVQITANRLEGAPKNVSLKMKNEKWKMKTKDALKEVEIIKTKVNGNPYLQGCITTFCLYRMNMTSEMWHTHYPKVSKHLFGIYNTMWEEIKLFCEAKFMVDIDTPNMSLPIHKLKHIY